MYKDCWNSFLSSRKEYMQIKICKKRLRDNFNVFFLLFLLLIFFFLFFFLVQFLIKKKKREFLCICVLCCVCVCLKKNREFNQLIGVLKFLFFCQYLFFFFFLFYLLQETRKKKVVAEIIESLKQIELKNFFFYRLTIFIGTKSAIVNAF